MKYILFTIFSLLILNTSCKESDTTEVKYNLLKVEFIPSFHQQGEISDDFIL